MQQQQRVNNLPQPVSEPELHPFDPIEPVPMNSGSALPDGHLAAPPFAHNPSAWSHRIPIAVLAGIAFFISVYMALYQWRLIPTVWDPVFGNGTRNVLDSEVSETVRV